MKRLLAVSLFFSLALAAADISGKWSGTAEIDNRAGGAFAVLKQAGGTVTGTIGPSEDEQFPLEKGSLEGDTLKFSIKVDLENGPQTLTGDFKLIGNDKLEGTVTGLPSGPAKVSFTRVK